MAQTPCVTDELYHVYNRGVDKRDVFRDDRDRAYFMHLLYVTNDTLHTENAKRTYERYISNSSSEHTEGGLTSFRLGERLVNIQVFALMPNHYHLLIKQMVDGGIGRFMQRVGTGYTMYFNLTAGRSGSLFQGTYKRALIDSNEYLLYIPHYIHANPIALTQSQSWDTQFKFLCEYKWCSVPDYANIKNYSSVLDTTFLTGVYGSEREYVENFQKFLRGKTELVTAPRSLLFDSM